MKTLTLIILSLAFMGNSPKKLDNNKIESEEIHSMFIVTYDINTCSTGDRFCNDCDPTYHFFISNTIEVTCYTIDFSIGKNEIAALMAVKHEFVRTLHYNYPKLTKGGDTPCARIDPKAFDIEQKWYMTLEDANTHREFITAKVRENSPETTIYEPHVIFNNDCLFNTTFN